MKEKLLHGVTVSKLLIASYCVLLVLVAVIRFIEYRQTREAVIKMEALTKTSNQKLTLLAAISAGYANEQKTISEYIHLGYEAATKKHEHSASTSSLPVASLLRAYQKLIRTPPEQTAFDQLLTFNKHTSQLNDSFLVAASAQPSKDSDPHFGNKKVTANANFNAATHKLQHLVIEQSQLDIAGVSQHIIKLSRRKELGSYLVIFLLLVLGLTIGNALKKLNRTETKYKLLFDHSSLPKFLVDPIGFRILDVNYATIDLYGYSKAELFKMRAFELRRPSAGELQNLVTEFQTLVKAGNTYSAKARHYKKNNDTVDVEINAHGVFAGDRKVLLVTINDITEKEKMEKHFAGAIIQTQEDERRQLGSDLHDNIGQILVSTQLYLSMAANKEYGDTDKFIAETQKYLTMAINETRNISHRVFPAFLEEIPFHEAIDHLLEGMNPGGRLKVDFEYDSPLLTGLINNDLKLHIYRILQEQLKNIQKYSQATAIHIELRKVNIGISIQIADNGVGFDTSTVKFGMGLLNIKKRAEFLSGKFHLITAPQQGCTLKVEIPITRDITT